MKKTALLVVDVQQAMMDDRPYRETELISNIGTLLRAARQSGIEVIYVRHDGGAGDTLEAHTPGWEISPAIAPEADERIFDKQFNSAFRGTGLREYLQQRGVGTLVLVGMQTEYCIDATCKVAFEYGFSVIIPEGATTTYDSGALSAAALAAFYEQRIWKGRFADVLPMEKAIARLETAALS